MPVFTKVKAASAGAAVGAFVGFLWLANADFAVQVEGIINVVLSLVGAFASGYGVKETAVTAVPVAPK